MNFKAGDKVRCLSPNGSGDVYEGTLYTIKCVTHNRVFVRDYDGHGTTCDCGGHSWEFPQECFELVESSISNNIILNMKEKFAQMFLAEPEKSFRKAGITNSDGMLTSEGKDIFFTWLLRKYGEEFKKEVVDVLLADEK